MESEIIVQFLTDYGYWILFPLMIVEGPVVTLIAAFMASFGIFNIYVVFFLSVLGDVFGDILFYGAGRRWGMGFVDKIGRHIGIDRELVVKMEKYFENHGGKTIFAVKSTTGLCWATFIAAGIIKMPFGKFVLYSVLGGFVWSAVLVIMGYFFGYLHEQIAEYINYAGWIIGSLAVAVFVGITAFKKYESKKLFLQNNVKNS
ncbi:MAG: DedA family protein [Patescibacteria group bacterium]